MPSIVTRGSFSGKAFGLTAQTAAGPVYVEDVFSTYLYSGTSATQTITNNIDLSTKGGMVWLKSRSTTTYNFLFNTNNGTGKFLYSNLTSPEQTDANTLSAYNTNGFTLGNDSGYFGVNVSGQTYVSWAFRKQPKFFDVVTYSGDGTSGRLIPHSLNCAPGLIIIKDTNGSSGWFVSTSALASDVFLSLNSTAAGTSGFPGSYAATSTTFTPTYRNSIGSDYVAYLFAGSNNGGFGLSGTDSVIACGSFNDTGGTTVTLGWEPQYILFKPSNAAVRWFVFDTMRGWTADFNGQQLNPNNSDAESLVGNWIRPTATGFQVNPIINANWIYMAIRRGPMKVPTSGTSVFSPKTATGTSIYDVTFDNSLIPDLIISQKNLTTGGTYNSHMFNDRLRGLPQDMTGSAYTNNPGLSTTSAAVEAAGPSPDTSNYFSGSYNSRTVWGGGWSSYNGIFYGLKRAPGFFDEVCYTGDGSTSTKLTHNLTVVPELLITKCRNSSTDGNSSWSAGWWVATGNPSYAYLFGPSSSSGLNSSGAGMSGGAGYFVSPDFTSSVYNPWLVTGSSGSEGPAGNVSGKTYVTYLFATCPGVSKVGIYTGTGAAQNINCGFSSTARFIMIKRIDTTGSWYLFDSAQGISSGNDPYVLMDTTAGQVTGTNYIGADASGFALTATAPAGLNASGGSYIFLAIS